jgi:hypothetical protein
LIQRRRRSNWIWTARCWKTVMLKRCIELQHRSQTRFPIFHIFSRSSFALASVIPHILPLVRSRLRCQPRRVSCPLSQYNLVNQPPYHLRCRAAVHFDMVHLVRQSIPRWWKSCQSLARGTLHSATATTTRTDGIRFLSYLSTTALPAARRNKTVRLLLQCEWKCSQHQP